MQYLAAPSACDENVGFNEESLGKESSWKNLCCSASLHHVRYITIHGTYYAVILFASKSVPRELIVMQENYTSVLWDIASI